MFAALQTVDTDTLSEAVRALVDSFASQNLILAVVAGVLVAGLVVLRFLGKKVPFIDAGVQIVLGVARRVGKAKEVPAPGVAEVVAPAKDGDAANGKEGLGAVIQIKKDE